MKSPPEAQRYRSSQPMWDATVSILGKMPRSGYPGWRTKGFGLKTRTSVATMSSPIRSTQTKCLVHQFSLAALARQLHIKRNRYTYPPITAAFHGSIKESESGTHTAHTVEVSVGESRPCSGFPGGGVCVSKFVRFRGIVPERTFPPTPLPAFLRHPATVRSHACNWKGRGTKGKTGAVTCRFPQ